MINPREVTLEEHKAIHAKLLEMQAVCLCEQTYVANSLALAWQWTLAASSKLNVEQGKDDVWQVAARCILPPNRW